MITSLETNKVVSELNINKEMYNKNPITTS